MLHRRKSQVALATFSGLFILAACGERAPDPGEVARGDFTHPAQHVTGPSGVCEFGVRVNVKPEGGTYFIDGRIRCAFPSADRELVEGAICAYDIEVRHTLPGGGGEALGKDTGGAVDCLTVGRFPAVEGECLRDECRGNYEVDATFNVNLPEGWAWLPRGEECTTSGTTENRIACGYFYREIQVN